MDGKTTEWRAGPNVCRCCLTEGCYKDISTEYFWMGKREVYAEMLSDTLNVSIAYSQSGGPNSNSRLICELCISRLRDASDFKRQVLECEKTFMQHLDAGTSNIAEIEIQVDAVDDVKLERVKQEKRLSDDDDDDDFEQRCGFDDDDDDLDDEPLTKLASKIPKKESVDILDLLDNTKATAKRKSSSKTKTVPAKKSKTVKKEPIKAGASKLAAAKTEKKKKDVMRPSTIARRNAETIVRNATVYPFRLPDIALICVYCAESYTDATLFRQHMKKEHFDFKVKSAFVHISSESYLKIDITEMNCRICFETFPRLEEIARHLNERHAAKIDFDFQLGLHPYKFTQDKLLCGVCDLNFSGMRQVGRHMTTHYQNHTCDTCGKSYTTNNALKQHLRFAHVGADRICRKCKETFSSLTAKREHITKSRKCWMYKCLKCYERFPTWPAKEQHLVDAHGLSKKTYSCFECNLSFPTRNSYRGHFNTTHAEINFPCTYCGRKFASQKYLEQHHLVHTGVRAFRCNLCSKSFSIKKNLTRHMWVHSDVKRFQCVGCKRAFNQAHAFKMHMKGHHPEIPEDKWQ